MIRASELIAACEPYLKDGETPVECIRRNRRDADAALEMLAAERVKVENYAKTMATISQTAHADAAKLATLPHLTAQAEALAGALENLTNNIVTAFPALAELGPITDARAALSTYRGEG